VERLPNQRVIIDNKSFHADVLSSDRANDPGENYTFLRRWR